MRRAGQWEREANTQVWSWEADWLVVMLTGMGKSAWGSKWEMHGIWDRLRVKC